MSKDSFWSKLTKKRERPEPSAPPPPPSPPQPAKSEEPVPPAPAANANPEGWAASQDYELKFWRDEWKFRELPLPELQETRHADAAWFLKAMNFQRTTPRQFDGFTGSVLEVGAGPIGFFELMMDVEVVAQDSLMALYARHLPFSQLGRRGATTYVPTPVGDISEEFDFVVCSNVLDHTADWIEFLEDCRRRVKPGGELLLFTESRGAPTPGHTQVFSPQQLQRMIRLLGATETPVLRFNQNKTRHCDFGNFIRARF